MKSFHFGPHQGHLAFALQSHPYYAQEHFHVGPQSSKSASDLFATANRRDRTRVTCLQRRCPRTDGDDFCRASLDLWLGPAWLLFCQGRTWQSTRNKWMLLGLQHLITTVTVRSVRDAAFISIIWAGDEVQPYCSLMKKWKKIGIDYHTHVTTMGLDLGKKNLQMEVYSWEKPIEKNI